MILAQFILIIPILAQFLLFQSARNTQCDAHFCSPHELFIAYLLLASFSLQTNPHLQISNECGIH